MNDAERDFYLRVVKVKFANLSKRERRRMWRKHRLLHIALDHLSRRWP